METRNSEEQLALSPQELNRIEDTLRARRQTAPKKSIQKRASIRLKNPVRQLSSFSKEELLSLDALAFSLQNVERNIESIDEFCQKRKINYLCELKLKMSAQDYKCLLSNAEIYRIGEGTKLQEEGKFHNYHYIIIEGSLGAYRQKKAKDEEKDYYEAFEFENGEAILSNTLQTHKCNPYTIRAKKPSVLLRFGQQIFLKVVKRIYQKEVDELATALCHTLPFRTISPLEMKKYLPYCSLRRFAFNELVYCEGDTVRQLFLILHGEAEIGVEADNLGGSRHHTTAPNLYKVNHQTHDKKQVKIVRVGKRELFGLETNDLFRENYYDHHVRVVSDSLKVLSMGLDVLYEIETENPALEDNLASYLKKVNTMHNALLQKHQKVTTEAPPKKKKKKRKMKRRSEISLQWWGLAQKIEGSKRYRLPTPPHSSQKALLRKEPLQLENRTSKLDYFKRRLFEDEVEGLQELQEKENEGNHPQALIPKLQKMKIKMLNPKPKVINNAQRIKRRLMDYAKNGEIYCDKLQLD